MVSEPEGGRRVSLRLLLFAVPFLLVVAAVVWVVVTGLMARSALNRVRADVAAVKTGDLSRVPTLLADIRRAHQLSTGPAWAAFARVPYAGAPLASVRDMTAALDRLASATPAIPDKIDTRSLAVLAPSVHALLLSTNRTLAAVASAPDHTWLPAVNSARTDLYDKLVTLRSGLQAGDLALPLLGVDGPKRYFIGIENDAEARGLGGLPGSFAIAVVDHGTVRFTHFEPDSALVGVRSGVDLGAEYRARYGNSNGLDNYLNSTISPNFPYVARIWAGMWQTKTGEHIDGAIAIDPVALSYFLAATGPAVMPDGTTVSAGSVVRLTLSTVYQRFGADQEARKKYLLAIAAAVQERVVSGPPLALAKAAARAAADRRLLVWSADRSIEARLSGTAVGGQLPAGALMGVTVTNAGGNKLDYYLDRTVSYVRTGCGAVNTVLVTMTLHNGAVAGLPAYVTARSDGHSGDARPGDNRLLVSAYTSTGSSLATVTVDGAPVRYWAAPELGHPVYTVDLELPRGATRVVRYRYSEPANGPVATLRQPLVRPLRETETEPSCRSHG